MAVVNKSKQVVYKACTRGKIAVLLIPAGALVKKHIASTARKNRASMAIVLAVTNRDGTKFFRSASRGAVFGGVKYEVGKTVVPDHFDCGPRECAGGIHFWRDRIDAYDMA